MSNLKLFLLVLATHLLIVHHLELKPKDSDAVLVLQRLLHGVVVDISVDQVELQGVTGLIDNQQLKG